LNLGQEFVIGGFTPGPHGLDAIIVGYYRGDELIYVARTRNGFVLASRRRVFEKLKPLVVPNCPFVNLPKTHKARWGEAPTAEKMKKCVWVRPEIVAQIEFLGFSNGPTGTISGMRSSRGCGTTKTLNAFFESILEEKGAQQKMLHPLNSTSSLG
jgi:ATP-dependent DNA ligase